MALPLALLLSSIMVMGKFGEDNELTAMKSAGLSLFRIMLPLTIMVLVMSVGAFLFSNYTWPSAHFEMRVLINDIQAKKTTLLIKENEYYNQLDGYSIKVGKKLDESHFEDVFIADHKGEESYKWREIYADKADMKKTQDGNYLILTLYNGFSDEVLTRNAVSIGDFPFRHTDFKRLKLTMDLKQFKFDRTETDQFKESILFKSFQQLTEDVDSMERMSDFRTKEVISRFRSKLYLFRDTNEINLDSVASKEFNLEELDRQIRNGIVSQVNTALRRTKDDLSKHRELTVKASENLITHVNMARNRIFTLSIALIVLFFIGAPLGAIVKKGGLGYPVVIAVLFFISYYLLSITGEKLADTQILSPFWGMWLSSLILAPIAMFLSYKANKDSVLFDKEFYAKLFSRKRKK